MVTVAVGDGPRTAEGASYPEDERRWSAFVRWLDLPAIYRVIRESGGSVRIAGDQLARLRPFCAADSARPLRGWLAASLSALDGRELGAIQLFDKHGAGFTVDDEAALVHLAQMTSAAVERARLYHERS
jgi:GAF domain-containing protein